MNQQSGKTAPSSSGDQGRRRRGQQELESNLQEGHPSVRALILSSQLFSHTSFALRIPVQPLGQAGPSDRQNPVAGDDHHYKSEKRVAVHPRLFDVRDRIVSNARVRLDGHSTYGSFATWTFVPLQFQQASHLSVYCRLRLAKAKADSVEMWKVYRGAESSCRASA